MDCEAKKTFYKKMYSMSISEILAYICGYEIWDKECLRTKDSIDVMFYKRRNRWAAGRVVAIAASIAAVAGALIHAAFKFAESEAEDI